jgi:hypothetical protein
MYQKYTWPCGCIFITEPFSNYQWYPCSEHSDLDMADVLCDILQEKDAAIEDLEDVSLTISYV